MLTWTGSCHVDGFPFFCDLGGGVRREAVYMTGIVVLILGGCSVPSESGFSLCPF